MVAIPGLTKDLWALPPRGISTSTVRAGEETITQYTYLCEKDGCFAMATSLKSEESARQQIAGHECPAPPRRGINPTGKSLLEKMWDESDDALDAFKESREFRDMSGETLKGYIMGIAECISFCAVPYFRNPKDVLRQMEKRWKMRQGLISFEPTPSYRFNPPPPQHLTSIPSEVKSASKPKKALSSKRTTAPKQLTPSRTFTSEEVSMIKEAVKNGISIADLAKMYGVSEGRIKTIVSPTESTQPFIGGLFA